MRRAYRRENRSPGFSLIELVVSIFILATAITAALDIFPSGGQANYDSRMRMMATHACRQILEYYVAQGYPSLSTGTTGPYSYPPSSPAGWPTLTTTRNGTTQSSANTTSSGLGSLQWTLTVTDVSATYGLTTGLKDVACTVTWSTTTIVGHKISHTLTLDTMVAE